MNLDEARAHAKQQRGLGKGLAEALVAFEGTGCDWPTLAWAIREAYGTTLLEFRQVFDAQYESLEPFKRRPSDTTE
jgi:hypothetical protein